MDIDTIKSTTIEYCENIYALSCNYLKNNINIELINLMDELTFYEDKIRECRDINTINNYKIILNNNIIDSMLLITRDGNIVWNDNNNIKPGEIFDKCINDSSYLKYIENNPSLSIETNRNEMQGLNDKIKELTTFKENVIYAGIYSENINNNIAKKKYIWLNILFL